MKAVDGTFLCLILCFEDKWFSRSLQLHIATPEVNKAARPAGSDTEEPNGIMGVKGSDRYQPIRARNT